MEKSTANTKQIERMDDLPGLLGVDVWLIFVVLVDAQHFREGSLRCAPVQAAYENVERARDNISAGQGDEHEGRVQQQHTSRRDQAEAAQRRKGAGIGQLDAFEHAVRAALARHPLLRAQIEPLGDRWHAWVLADSEPAIDWGPLNAPLFGGYGQGVDLRHRTGLAIWVRQGDERSELFLQFHHACCDGIGGFRFVEDLLVAYAAEIGGDGVPSPGPLDVHRLEMRGSFGLEPRPLRQRMQETWYGMKEAFRFYRQAPLSLAIPKTSPNDETSANGVGFVSERFPVEKLRALRGTAARRHATLNDVLLRDFFLTLSRWNRQHGEARSNHYLRVVIPQNLRSRDDLAMPAANIMSYSFLTRRMDQCEAADELLESVQLETRVIRKYRLSLYFIGVLAFANRLKWLMSLSLRSKQCFATAVLTNLGDPTRRFLARFPRTDGLIHVGNLILKDITGIPPIRPMTRAAFSITTYAGQLTISAMCDENVMSMDDARTLLRCYVSHLEESCRG